MALITLRQSINSYVKGNNTLEGVIGDLAAFSETHPEITPCTATDYLALHGYLNNGFVERLVDESKVKGMDRQASGLIKAAKDKLEEIREQYGLSKLEMIFSSPNNEGNDFRDTLNWMVDWADKGGEQLTVTNYLRLKSYWYNGITTGYKRIAEKQGIEVAEVAAAFEKVGEVLKRYKEKTWGTKGTSELSLVFEASYEDNANVSELMEHLKEYAKRGEHLNNSQREKLWQYKDKGITKHFLQLAEAQRYNKDEVKNTFYKINEHNKAFNPGEIPRETYNASIFRKAINGIVNASKSLRNYIRSNA